MIHSLLKEEEGTDGEMKEETYVLSEKGEEVTEDNENI